MFSQFMSPLRRVPVRLGGVVVALLRSSAVALVSDALLVHFAMIVLLVGLQELGLDVFFSFLLPHFSGFFQYLFYCLEYLEALLELLLVNVVLEPFSPDTSLR